MAQPAIGAKLILLVLLFSNFLHESYAFQPLAHSLHNNRRIAKCSTLPISHYGRWQPTPSHVLFAEKDGSDMETKQQSKEKEEYRSPVTEFLSNFMEKENKEMGSDDVKEDPLAAIDFSAPKLKRKLSIEKLATLLDSELYYSEWFVTGKVNPIYFAESFVFEDPDVKLAGIEAYARGVNKLFNQECSRAEIISTVVNDAVPNTITCTWRLSGKADIGPGLTIKPYIVYTDFKVDPESSLIVFQEDRFGLPSWDILLSSLFPFLIGKLTAPPAPPVEKRNVPLPTEVLKKQPLPVSTISPWDMMQNIFKSKV